MSKSSAALCALLLSACAACIPNPRRDGTSMSRIPGVESTVSYSEIGQTGLMVIEASVNGSAPLRFLFDSGAAGTLLFVTPRTERLGLPLGSLPARSRDEDAKPIPSKALTGISIQVGNVRLDRLTVRAMHWSQTRLFPTVDKIWCDGVIGFDLLRHVAAEIARQEKTITFRDSRDVVIPDDWDIASLEVRERKPYCYAHVRILDGDPPRKVKLHVDLGMAGFLALNPDESSGIRTPPHSTAGEGWLNGRVVHGSSAPIRELQFLSRRFEEVLTSFPTSGHPTAGDRNGSIGSLILRRFDLVIDFSGRRLAGKPAEEAERLERSAESP